MAGDYTQKVRNMMPSLFGGAKNNCASEFDIAEARSAYARMKNRAAVGEESGTNPISQASAGESEDDFVARVLKMSGKEIC